jgi:hypothetical protein
MEKLGKVRRLQKQANFLRAEMSVTGADTWRRFTVGSAPAAGCRTLQQAA